MSRVFSFRFPPETTWDERKGWPILSLILATVSRASVGALGPNEAKTHRPGFMKLTARGRPDSVIRSALETTGRRLDVSRASGASQFFSGFRAFGIAGNSCSISRKEDWESSRKNCNEHCRRQAATVVGDRQVVSRCETHRSPEPQASSLQPRSNRCNSEEPRRSLRDTFCKQFYQTKN
jgi:hypothetical protein